MRQLDEMYPNLREKEPVLSPMSTIGTPVEHLDLVTVLKVSEAVSGEIVLEKLIDTLMRTAIEHAGAERGLLILPRGSELRIQAEATTAAPRSGSISAIHHSPALKYRSRSFCTPLVRRRVSSLTMPRRAMRLEATSTSDASTPDRSCHSHS